jgi:hypothetical protein
LASPIPPEAPSIEQQLLVLYSLPSAREAHAACPCVKSSHSLPVAALRRCTIFKRTGRADWPTLPRSQRGKAQPTTSSSTDGSSLSMARLSHKPHLLTVKRRRVAELPMAEHSACADRSSMLQKHLPYILQRAKTVLPKSRVVCNKDHFSVLCWEHSDSADLCSLLISSLEHRLFCQTPLTCILTNQLVGWRAATPSRR